jgi:pyrimidine operon attenuation protein/uracil phosphoribosyltransferase
MQIDAELLYQNLLGQLRQAYGHGGAFQAAHERTEGQDHSDGAALVGIHSGGAWLAERLAQDLGGAPCGVVNVALHRDDYAKKGLHSRGRPTLLPFSIGNRRIVLVDDVLYTGRTIRAAINELYDYGRAASIELAVLVDRGGRELPIAARFVGQQLELPTDTDLVLSQSTGGALEFHTEVRPV